MFISRKIRKFNKEAFGFMRFKRLEDAINAIRKLNGFPVRGRMLKVLMARYSKDGISFKRKNHNAEDPGYRRIINSSFRDHRKYSDVLMGEQQKSSTAVRGTNVIPIMFTINAAENKKTVKLLDYAIPAKNTEVMNLANTSALVSASSASVKGMYSLSPTKNLIVFECENDANEDSDLWNVFDDNRRWSEGELYDDRLVWLDYYGIHPKCWSMENVRKIGE